MAASNKIQVGYIEAQDGAQFEVDAGTAAAPGLCFDNSAATGLYSPGTGQIAWSTSGKQTALRILADGKVGVDCSPTVAFEVNGTIKASAIDAPIEGTLDDWIVHAGDTNTKIGFPANDQFSVETGGSQRLLVQDAGAKVTGTLELTDSLYWDGDTNTTIDNAGGTADFIRFKTGGTTVMDIDGDQHIKIHDNRRLRIGASNDIQIFHNSGNNRNYFFSPQNDVYHEFAVSNSWTVQTSAGDKRILCPANGTSTAVELYHNGSKKLETTSSGATVTGTVVSTGLDVNGSSTFGANGSITSGGNFTISSNALTVTGSATVVGEFKGATIPTIQVTQTTNSTDLQLRANATGGLVRTATQKPLILGTHQQERVRITSGGVVNIGANFTQTTYPFSVQKDLDSGGNLAYFANSDSTYSQGLTLSFDSNKDIEWSGGSGAGGMDWNMGTRGYKWRVGGNDRALLSQYATLTLESGSQGANSKPGIELKSTGYTGNITKLYQDSPNAFSALETTERSLVLDVDSQNQVNGTYLSVHIDGTEEFRFDPGSIEYKNSNNQTRGVLLAPNNYYSNTNLYIDLTQWRLSDNWNVLEVFGTVNPNSSGSGAYADPVHMYIYRGTGWDGAITHWLYCASVAPPARHAYPSGTGYAGNAGISAVWYTGSSIRGNKSTTSTDYVRLLIPNANAGANFQKNFRVMRRF